MWPPNWQDAMRVEWLEDFGDRNNEIVIIGRSMDKDKVCRTREKEGAISDF